MPDSAFHSTIFTYPWDLTDEGLDVSLARIADTAGCGEIMLTPSYHVATYFLPHNPKRPFYFGEDGAVYFQPDLKKYDKSAIRPRVSEVVQGARYFDDIVAAMEKRKIKLGLWIVYLFNHYLARTFPQFAKHDAFGNPYLSQLSTASPDVQEYVVALTADLVERYKPGSVYVESLCRLAYNYGFNNPKVLSEITSECQLLLGLCFNPSSMKNAEQGGLDAEKFRRDVAEYLRPRLQRLPKAEDRHPITEVWISRAFDGRLKKYLDISAKQTTALWLRVAEVIHRGGAKLFTDGPADIASSRRTGLMAAINAQIDRASITGLKDDQASREKIARLRERIAPDCKLLLFVSPGQYTDPAPLFEELHSAAAAGVDGASFYNYGLLREEQLAIVGEALRGV
jgi:hypothetical protein